jgi:hypothetical protein
MGETPMPHHGQDARATTGSDALSRKLRCALREVDLSALSGRATFDLKLRRFTPIGQCARRIGAYPSMTSKKLFFALFVMLGSVLLAQPANLPPALRAAVQSGNTSAVTQAINTLSGGNPTQAAALAAQVAAAAEAMMATNPQAALNAASAAVG